MNTTEDIRTLINRFFEGETTLQEEQRLYAFFRGPVPADLEELRPVFQGLDALQLPEEKQPKRATISLRKAWAVGAAAAVVLAVGAGIWIKEIKTVAVSPTPTLYEAYVYNCHTTDSTEVMSHVSETLQALCDDPADDVDQQLRTLFEE